MYVFIIWDKIDIFEYIYIYIYIKDLKSKIEIKNINYWYEV